MITLGPDLRLEAGSIGEIGITQYTTRDGLH